MAELAIKILNICLYPFQNYDNPIILVPLAFICTLGVFGIFARLIKQ
jgi:hypothetical protein